MYLGWTSVEVRMQGVDVSPELVADTKLQKAGDRKLIKEKTEPQLRCRDFCVMRGLSSAARPCRSYGELLWTRKHHRLLAEAVEQGGHGEAGLCRGHVSGSVGPQGPDRFALGIPAGTEGR